MLQSTMRLPSSFTTVTPLSKFLTLFLFILFPLVGFTLGMEYQKFISVDSDNKYYVAKGKNCELIEYSCPMNYKGFNDEIGCGCEFSNQSTVTPTPINDTSNWKTYRNKEYGFEFMYPVTATVKESNNTNIVQLEYRDDNGKGAYGAWWWNVYIQTLNTMVSDDIEAWVTRNYLVGYEENEEITSIAKENATISGKESFRYEYINKPTGLKVTKIWINNNDAVLFIYFESFSGDSHYLSTFNQILSTFRFLDETPKESSGAITYTNSRNGFTFTLPQSWTGYTVVQSA